MVGAVVFAWLNLKINSERLQADFEALAEIGVTLGWWRVSAGAFQRRP